MTDRDTLWIILLSFVALALWHGYRNRCGRCRKWWAMKKGSETRLPGPWYRHELSHVMRHCRFCNYSVSQVGANGR